MKKERKKEKRLKRRKIEKKTLGKLLKCGFGLSYL
jgi:hypothetical protein